MRFSCKRVFAAEFAFRITVLYSGASRLICHYPASHPCRTVWFEVPCKHSAADHEPIWMRGDERDAEGKVHQANIGIQSTPRCINASQLSRQTTERPGPLLKESFCIARSPWDGHVC